MGFIGLSDLFLPQNPVVYLITSPMNIAIEVPTQPVAQRDLATGCRYAGTHGGWCPGRTSHRPAMPGVGLRRVSSRFCLKIGSQNPVVDDSSQRSN
jgi:hypothetical protein